MCRIKFQRTELFVSLDEFHRLVSWRKLKPNGSSVSLLRIGAPTDYGCLRTDLANCQTGLLFDGIGWPTISSRLPDRPYHPDTKIVFPKCAFVLTMLASPDYDSDVFHVILWRHAQNRYFSTGPLVKSWRRHCTDVKNSTCHHIMPIVRTVLWF